MNIVEALRRSVESHPERKALESQKTSYSYEEVWEKAGKVAGLIRENNLEGEKIAFSAGNGPESLITVLGIWMSGSTCVHINPRLEASEVDYYMQDSGASAVFHGEGMEEKFSDYRSFAVGQTASESVEAEAADICSITYTSGTTGKPKGVPFTHSRLLHGSLILVVEALEARGIEPSIIEELRSFEPEDGELEHETFTEFIADAPLGGDTHVVIYPLYHVSGTNPSLATLIAGGKLVLPEREVPEVMRAIETHEAELTGGVPAQLTEMAELSDEYDVTSLEYVHTAGGLLTDNSRKQVVEQLTENLCHEYASSETLEIAYSLDNSGALGETTYLQDVRIVRPGTLEEVDQGEKGEAVLNTDVPTVFDGYWRKPEKTEASIEQGWYRTGDLVREDEQGRLWFEGRADNLIVSGGENISPARVENAMASHPEVEEAGVIGVEDDEWGQRVVAYYEGEAGPDEIDEFLKKGDLADFKRPKQYMEKDKLPVNETGGVDRKRLEEVHAE